MDVTVFCKLLMEVTSHHLCCIKLIRVQSLGQSNAQWGLYKSMETRRQSSLGTISEAMYHNQQDAGRAKQEGWGSPRLGQLSKSLSGQAPRLQHIDLPHATLTTFMVLAKAQKRILQRTQCNGGKDIGLVGISPLSLTSYFTSLNLSVFIYKIERMPSVTQIRCEVQDNIRKICSATQVIKTWKLL